MRRLSQLFVLGCAVSLIVSGRLTLRLILGGMLGWAIVPLVELAVEALARPREPINALGRPILLVLLIGASITAVLTPIQSDVVWGNTVFFAAFLVAFSAAVIWSRPRQTTALRVAVWVVVLASCLALAGWPIVAQPLGLP